jgi:hypothetical protein
LFKIIFLVALLGVPALYSKTEPFLFISLYDFTQFSDFFQAVIRDYEIIERRQPIAVDRNGRNRPAIYFKNIKNHRSIRYHFTEEAGKLRPVDLLDSVEREALRHMLFEGYISEELFAAVTSSKNIWHPSQVRFAITWSEMTLPEALEYFDGKIPWRRVMGAQPPPGPRNHGEWTPLDTSRWQKEKLRIVRSSLMVGTGQAINPFTGNPLQLPLAWQKANLITEKNTIDRNLFPLVAEFSRAHVEGPELAGDLRPAFVLLLTLLENEARLLNVPISRYALFARAIKPDRGALFARTYRMQVWNEDLVSLLKENSEAGLERLESAASPHEITPETVFATTLAKARNTFSVGDPSVREAEFSRLLGGKFSGLQMRELNEYLAEKFWNYLLFPQFPLQRGPICIHNSAENIIAPQLNQKLVSLGFDQEAEFRVISDYINGKTFELLNLFSSYWNEPSFVKTNESGVKIENISEPAVLAYGEPFLASVLLSVAEIYESEINDKIFWSTKIKVATLSQITADALVAMGGERTVAPTVGLTINNLGQLITGYLIDFDQPRLSALKQKFRTFSRAPDCPELLRRYASFVSETIF